MTSSPAGAPTPRRPYSFDRRLKLTRGADFEAVFKDGRRSADRLFTVLYRKSGLEHARLGMTISAKRVRTAVGRNRIRRLARESFRHTQTELAGLDIVIVVKDPARDATNTDIFTSLESHFKRLARTGDA